MSAKELLFAFYYSHDIQPPFKVSETIEANALVAQINKRVHIKFGWGYGALHHLYGLVAIELLGREDVVVLRFLLADKR